MPRIWLHTAIVTTLVVANAAFAEDVPNPAAGNDALAASIEQLVDDLDNPNYEARRSATKKLSRIGHSAVKPLMQAAQGESLERAVRAIDVLGSIYESGDRAAWTAAHEALDALQKSKHRSVAGRAAGVFASLAVIRERRSLEAIQELGGVVMVMDLTRNTSMEARLPNLRRGVDTVQESYQVRLGMAWKGGDAGLKFFDGLRIKSSRGTELFGSLYVIDGADISPSALTQLKMSHPTLEIQDRGRSCLGVSSLTSLNAEGCKIGLVTPGSAAEKAKMLPNDLIRTFNGQPVPSFEILIEEIRKTAPGDKVFVEVTRNGIDVKLNVVMQEWSK